MRVPSLYSFSWKQNGPHLLIVFCCLIVTYLYTMPRVVMLEDSGLFTLVCYFGGIAHPPGYPLYTLLCMPFARLPFVSVAMGINIFSACMGALTCGVLYWLAIRLLQHRSYGYLAALGYGFSHVFWSQAIIQEVYTLNTLLFFLLLALALQYAAEKKWRVLCIFVGVYGLGLSNHWPLLLLSTPGLCIILLPAFTAIKKALGNWRKVVALLALMMLGVSPYLYLVIRSQMDPLISFYGPTSTQVFPR